VHDVHKVRPKCRRNDGVPWGTQQSLPLFQGVAIDRADDGGWLSKIRIHMHDMHEDKANDDTLVIPGSQ